MGNAVFFAELSLGFAVLVERNEGFLKILIIFGVVVCSYENPPSLCIVYCNRQCISVSTFLV